VRDVVVIGGGPAGSTAAERLARHGLDVVLLEEHEAIGAPVHCTGLLGAEAFAEFDLPADLILGQTTAARFWGAAGQSVRVESERVRAAVIDRAALDRLLADRAAAHGVTIRLGCRVESLAITESGVRVTAPSLADTVDARACVLACGANYRFHKPLGLGVPRLFLQSAQLEAPFPPVGDVQVRLGRAIAPGGFAWLVPLTRGGRSFARIGLMSETRGRERFAAAAAALCRGTDVRPADLGSPRLKMLPLGPVARTYADRVVAVGDAAGLVKPTTGGGIYYGLLSGAAAADTLAGALAADRLDAGSLRRYETRWRRQLGSEISAGLRFRQAAAGISDESIDALIELGRVNGVVPLLQKTASFNWHRKAALALLAHPAFRRIVASSWRVSARPV
jgi:geranylgeranyl reductase family protein